ncbi:hypothetical protein [Gynuella sunshinyii]|uniref:Right handed beta helix domain-containing protein n=1 Tax=Gynuella sunshinyii YC6258 TaxID=1445510 RepID=A0A0C5VHK4_9GAMM|nr:hypothetical protein [Gynuella sunshinyii]AJQ92813.1 hypothetical Protein YC6258_00763 [Gynuella sunshinyii YC6258]
MKSILGPSNIFLILVKKISILFLGIIFTSYAYADNYSVEWESKFNLPPQDTNGWSILKPSEDSRIIYVSNEGNDTTAEVYKYQDLTDLYGNSIDVFIPTWTIKPYASIDEALKQVRDGYPDYILLKRGDVWNRTSVIKFKAGSSVTNRSVFGYYGSNKERPLIKTGSADGIILNNAQYSAIIGIKFVADARDPKGDPNFDFSSASNPKGFQALNYGTNLEGHILIEDCWFDWYANNTIQDINTDLGLVSDIVLRRNIISNNYATSGHSQGVYAYYSSTLLEENFFDHNGWYQPGDGSTQGAGGATIFNHNTYFAESRETIFRNNIFARASSISNKFTSNTTEGTNQILAWEILLDNNLYLQGEVGVSLGGNKDQNNGPRWEDIRVVKNVFMNIGETQPTGRNIAWGLGVDDWKSGLVADNIFTNWGSVTLNNVYAISSSGHTTNVEFARNIVEGLISSKPLVTFNDATQSGIYFHDNEIRATTTENVYKSGRIMKYAISNQNKFSNNYYVSDADQSEWFVGQDDGFMSFSEYLEASGEVEAKMESSSNFDPNRTIGTYLTQLKQDASKTDEVSKLVELMKNQSKFNWNQYLSAVKINQYIRNGYCKDGADLCDDAKLFLYNPSSPGNVSVQPK